MLQNMQKKVDADAEREKELFDKFMCYCKNGAAELEKSIAHSGDAIPELSANIEEAQSQLVQLKEDLKKVETDRAAAKTAMAEATAIREKDAAAYAEEAGKQKSYLADVNKAITAIEHGAVGAFLQTTSADALRNLIQDADSLSDVDREDVTAFLTNDQPAAAEAPAAAAEAPAAAAEAPVATAEAPVAAEAAATAVNASAPEAPAEAPVALGNMGMIAGILKEMGDRMNKKIGELVTEEEASIKVYDGLISAKTAEVEALTSVIVEKPVRIGELGVQIVQMKADLGDTQESLLDDKKFAADLEKNCATKEAEWAEVCKTRSEENLALADTIKILNDDDALEMFKKTLPGASSSFLRVAVSEDSIRTRALNILQDAKVGKKNDSQNVDFIMLALRGKKVGFDKIVKMIDNMVALLQEEAVNDQAKKEYCERQFDLADDKKKGLERGVGKLESTIADVKESIAALKEEIAALGQGIVALDKNVAEATDQRREENSDYKTLMMNNQAAKELLQFAKNRLNKFYNPKLYKPPAMFMQIFAHRNKAEPGPPPAAPGAHTNQDGNGVIAMIDTLIKGLDTEMTEAEVNEKNAQEEYEQMMADSAAKRASDAKSLAEKSAAQADGEVLIVAKGGNLKSTQKELMATHEFIGNLHSECDWMLKFFGIRAEARNGEIDSLKAAKAVLSGADFSLVQKSASFLRK